MENKSNSKTKIKSKLVSGFSLIETLVAITILLLAIAGPLTIAHRALFDSRVAKNQITARFLAQDAMEYIKNIRDKNNITGAVGGWLSSINSCSPKCTVDTVGSTPGIIHNVCNTDCPALRLDSATGLYGYDQSWEDTIFTRTVSVVPDLGNPDEAVVTVNVNWNSGTLPGSISLKEHIFNWSGN